jgi:eukaryotic-like serine/threonine-protein kinase
VADSNGTVSEENPVSVGLASEEAGESTHGTIDASVLEKEEHRRRIGALKALLASYSISTVVLLATFDGQPGYGALIALCVGNALLAALLLFIARKRRYPDVVSTGVGVSGAALALAGCAYFGVNSASVVGLPVLIYYFGLGDSALRRRVVLGVVLVGYACIVLFTLAGWIPERGLTQQPDPHRQLIGSGFMALIALQIMALTYWLARKSRRSTLLAMTALEQARLRIRQRDALLQEANADLNRVMAGARLGRYSGGRIGAFEVGDVIGRGAIGEVYEARHVDDQRAVAIKVLHPHLQDDRGHVKRFLREAEITGSLDSPHIPRTFESGVAGDGAPFLAMELLAGSDLASELRRKKRLALPEVDQLVEQVASALTVAHAAGVVHRDIKPQNLFRTDANPPLWKILDFGVSKLTTGSGTLTGGAAVGTPAYMAPEQVAGGRVDARADVFAFAAVAYRALTGRPAFSGPSELVTMLRVTQLQPARPAELVDVHPDVDLLFALGFAKNPELRVPSAAEFAESWKAARQGRLDSRLRESARRILSTHPWGEELEPDEMTTVLARET